jgi:hypothetical protein
MKLFVAILIIALFASTLACSLNKFQECTIAASHCGDICKCDSFNNCVDCLACMTVNATDCCSCIDSKEAKCNDKNFLADIKAKSLAYQDIPLIPLEEPHKKDIEIDSAQIARPAEYDCQLIGRIFPCGTFMNYQGHCIHCLCYPDGGEWVNCDNQPNGPVNKL